MINASFERNQRAAISGAYQYDKGQRLVMHGLPEPDELAGEDDLLSGELPLVQAQFAYRGDSQAESSLAIWDEERWAWICPIPDSYLTRSEDVHVFISVYYGETDELGSRAKTMYEAVFRPISRPAPGDTVTDAQIEVWAAKREDIEMALTAAQTAADNAEAAETAAAAAADAADAAAGNAETAEADAEAALRRLVAASGAFTNANLVIVPLAAGSAATASYDGITLTLGVPKGETGAQGAQGATGPGDISLAYSSGSLTITPTT